MTLANTTMKDSRPTPVNSAIWMSGQFACSATPRPFQPKPVKSHPRTHSCATQAHASKNASRKLLVDLSHGVFGTGAGWRARSSIELHLLAAGWAVASAAGTVATTGGRSNPQNQLQNAKLIPR